MAFIVTARKWRPKRFDEVAGQEHITATLKNALCNNRIAHAYLFTGPRGVGKTTTARIMAKALNCLNPNNGEPCNECEMCNSIQSAQSMDIIEIDGASNRGIDEIRTLRDSVKYAPTKGKYKIYIIDEVHMLTKESFNAFLKTLEEPPAHTIFIFATTDVHKVPLTIISRCQRFDFRRIQLDTIKSQLSKIAEEEKIQIDDKTLTIIGKKADGALRDAESFFDQIVSFCGNKIDAETVAKMLNLIDDDIYFKISNAVLDKNFKAVFEVSNSIYDNGWNFIDFMDGLIDHFRNILTVVLTKNTNLVESADVYKSSYTKYENSFSEGDILRLLNFLNKTKQELRFSQNQKLKIEISLCQLVGLEKTATISELLKKVQSPVSSNLNNAGIQEKQNTFYGKDETGNQSISTGDTEKKTSGIMEFQPHYSVNNQFPEPENIQFDFNSIMQKWAGFADSVSSDMGLILGPFIKQISPLELNGNKLKIYSEDYHGKDIINRHQEYLAKKTLEFFGKKISFQFSSTPIEHSAKSSKHLIEKFNTPKSFGQQEDPYINAIINELGGEEIR